MRNVQLTSRAAAIAYFKEKSEVAISFFKQEQMFMVESYYNMKKEKKSDEIKIFRMSKTITN